MFIRIRYLTLILAAAVSLCCRRSAPGGLDPEQALKSFRLHEDFRIELFAAEPMVLDPVDMVFDEYGRAFVADMLDLPWDPPPGKPARSRIVMLEDTDGDGRADKSVVFAENVLQVSGLAVWQGGLIVPSAPHIYYMKDTDGDGKADVREILFTGFFQGNPEAQITNPRLGIDNWFYFSNTGNAGRIRSPKWPAHPVVEVRGMDFRYHPVRHIAEPASGAAQYGSTFDDWGNRFISQNTIHLRHVVAPMHYLMRAPLLSVPSVNHDPYGQRERRMWPLTAPQQWRVERTRLRQQRYDENKSGRVEHASGWITGATGSTVYTGDAWPESYRGVVLTGDVSGNLVRLDRLTPDGVTFSARPDKEGVEFLASTDQWFRPTCFANAPDGNLYMMDMYREIIETPLSIPEELQRRLKLDFYRGNDRGRIYRIVARQPRQRQDLRVNLGRMRAEELVRTLEHDNGWHRQTAQRLLVERRLVEAAPALRALARTSAKPLARLHALWTLEGLDALTEEDILLALQDAHAGIREHAVRLSEALPVTPRLENALLARQKDAEIRIRFQLAFTLGRHENAQARRALAALGATHADNPWFRIAVLSSAAHWPADLFSLLIQAPGALEQKKELMAGAASLIGARRQPAEIGALLAATARLSAPQTILDSLAQGLASSGALALRVPQAESLLARWLNSREPSLQTAAWRLAPAFFAPALMQRAAREAFALDKPAAVRAAAITALRGAPFESAFPILEKVLASHQESALQVAALEAMAGFRRREVGGAVLAHWKSYPPEARRKALSVLVGQRERIPLLLEALEKGTIEAAVIEVNIRNRLIEDQDPAIAGRARKIFESAVSDRDKVVARYRDALQLAGNATRGKKLFEDNCARCHSPRQKGGRIGPDLSGVNNKSKEELLEAILNPSRAIEPRYVNYIVSTKDGQMFDGVLASETPGAITLRGGAEEDITLLRSMIQEIRTSSISLMPEDFEKNLSKQDLADVIAYLRAGL